MTIKASEGHTEISSIQTLIDNKRELAFLATSIMICNEETYKAIDLANEHNIKSIKVKNRIDGEAWVFYKTNVKDAQLLADFAASKGGYLNDSNREEAYFVGNLLGYNQSDIEEYCLKLQRLGYHPK